MPGVDRAERARVGAGALGQLEARAERGLGVLLLEHAVPGMPVLGGVGEVGGVLIAAPWPRKSTPGRSGPRTRSPGCRPSSGRRMAPRLAQRERPVRPPSVVRQM